MPADVITLADSRELPIVWADPRAVALLPTRFEKRKLPLARSIYYALCELACERRGAFEASRKEVAERAGVTKKALDDYTPGLEDLGLLRIDRRRGDDDARNLPNLWLVTHPGDGHRDDPRHPDDPLCTENNVSSSSLQVVENHAREGNPTTEARLPKTVRLYPSDRSRPVSEEEHELCDRILAYFSRKAEVDPPFSSVDFRAAIIRRIKEHPEFPPERHKEIIDRNFADPWWDGIPAPSVIYGSAAQFEKSTLCAGEARGRRRRGGDKSAKVADTIRRLDEIAKGNG